MKRVREPVFRDLDMKAVHALLARNHVGRIAYSFHDRVEIEPISYVFADDAIYMRTSPGSKLATLAHTPWVAFEVDEVDGPFEWQSVVAHGTVYILQNAGSVETRASYRHAVERIRELTPEALTDDDPTPTRQVVLKLFLSELTGREARPELERQAKPRPKAGRID